MKLTLLFLMIMIWGGLAAQPVYKLTVSQETYQELTNPHYFSASDSADGGYYLTRNMKFPAFDKDAGFNMNFNPPSRGGWISPQGYMAVYEVPSYGATIVFQAFLSNMEHSGNSSVTYQYDGTPGSGILKIQWKNFGIIDEPNGYMNLQLWLDEGTETVSYHYGPSRVDSAKNSGGYAGIFIMANDFSQFFQDFRIQGNPASPVTGAATNFGSMSPINGIPAPNTVYTIAFNSSTGITAERGEQLLSLYPNPAADVLSISAQEPIRAVKVYDLCGKLIKTEIVNDKNISVNVSELQGGSYIIEAESSSAVHRQMFIKE